LKSINPQQRICHLMKMIVRGNRGIRRLLVIAFMLTMIFPTLQVQHVAAISNPTITSIQRDGVEILGTAGNLWLSDPHQIAPTGWYGPVIIGIAYAIASPPYVVYETGPHTYTITMTLGGHVPVIVGANGLIHIWVYDTAGAGTLTLTVDSIERKTMPPPPAPQTLVPFYAAGFMVNFDNPQTYLQGSTASFDSDNFTIGQGTNPGSLVITASGDAWRTTEHFTGTIRLFVPTSAPANFGKTINDVVISMDGAAVVATTSDTTPVAEIGGVWAPGRLWTFTFPFSVHKFESDVNTHLTDPNDVVGPSGDESTNGNSFTASDVSLAVKGLNPADKLLLIGSGQIWNDNGGVGSSLGICKNGALISSDVFAAGATATHRHFATAIATDTPGSGTVVYTLCYKSDPGGKAWLSSGQLVRAKVDNAETSLSQPDESTSNTGWTATGAVLSNLNPGMAEFILIGEAQVWNDKSNVGTSLGILRDGTLLSSDMYTVGTSLGHRHIATTIAVDSGGGTHTYSLGFKTDPTGRAWASGKYLLAFTLAGSNSKSSGTPGGDQSTVSTSFTGSTASTTFSAGSGQYLVLAVSQLWNDVPAIGPSMTITRDGTKIAGDMYTSGASLGHRHLPFAVAIDTPGTGTHTYTLSFKTDPGGKADVSATILLVIALS
jgi:hypothetical protein